MYLENINSGRIYHGFVTRFSGDLKTLFQSTYVVGDSNSDYIGALAIAANGDVVVGGFTDSTNLPGASGGAQPERGGGYEHGFVARLSGDLKTLVQSTYVGGSGYDWIFALAIAANGDVVVGGDTGSGDLPGTSGGAQSYLDAGGDGFVTRLSGDLKTRYQSTYVGGSGSDTISTLAIAANGDVVVGGDTNSADLPGTRGGAQSYFDGGYDGERYDGFVTRLSGDLKTRFQSTYVGSFGDDRIKALAIAANGDVVVGGYTGSGDLPGTLGGAQPRPRGDYDGFVTRLSGDLKTRIQSTYVGGGGSDYIRALAIAANGDVVVGGSTYYSTNLPGTAGGAQPSFGGRNDGFVTRLSGDLKTLVQSTYVGGSGDDHVYAFAIAANGDVVVGGTTNSTDLPGTSGGAQASLRGNDDGFVARLSGDLKAASAAAAADAATPVPTLSQWMLLALSGLLGLLAWRRRAV